ncbi:MAG: hypothetical protein ACK47B_01210 [Armatimonadota bacterium]
MLRRLSIYTLLGLGIGVFVPTAAEAAPVVVRGSGDITAAVTAFRAALGNPANGATPGEQPSGRREINWDAVPADVTNTNTFPAAFFNTTSTRGAVFSPANGFRVSDVNFADINPTYEAQFNTFSAPKSFMVVGSNTFDVEFQVAGETTPAAVNGFGVVFSDVDRRGSARLEFFQGPISLGVFSAPRRSDANGLSFVGVTFSEGERVTRVRVTSGDAPLAAGRNDVSAGGNQDLVVMDDFLYGEPRADSDRDGVLDEDDERPNSDTRAKVDVNGEAVGQTSLDNRVRSDGFTIQDLIEDVANNSQNRRQFIRRLQRLVNELRKDRLITRAEGSALVRAGQRRSFNL